MACPSDPEAKRPKNFIEAISGDESWNAFGLRVKWTDPVVPGNLKLPIGQPVTLKLCVETRKGFNIVPDALSAWCWTHIRADDNPCGVWREIRLHYNPKCTIQDEHGHFSHVFQASVVPTADDLYRLTFNVKYQKMMIWANYFQVDNVVDVHVNPSVGTQYDQVVGPVAWKAILRKLMPQSFPFYPTYFCNLFSDNQQSGSSQGTSSTPFAEPPSRNNLLENVSTMGKMSRVRCTQLEIICHILTHLLFGLRLPVFPGICPSMVFLSGLVLRFK